MPAIKDRAHRCGWPNCPRMVPLGRWGCREHWQALPNNLRAWIGRAYRAGIETGTHPSRSWLDAHHAALEWICEDAEERQECGRSAEATHDRHQCKDDGAREHRIDRLVHPSTS